MLNYQQALELLRSFPIEKGHDWDRHCIHVGDTAYKLALTLKEYILIDPEKVRVMGLIHDIGRSVSQCPYRHAYEGYKLMKALGEAELARICACHSNGTFRPEDLPDYGLKPEDFFISTLEEMLVFMADNLECHGLLVRQEQRLAEVMSRYEKSKPEFIPVLQSKFREFQSFDEMIKSICHKGIYEILGI